MFVRSYLTEMEIRSWSCMCHSAARSFGWDQVYNDDDVNSTNSTPAKPKQLHMSHMIRIKAVTKRYPPRKGYY